MAKGTARHHTATAAAGGRAGCRTAWYGRTARRPVQHGADQWTPTCRTLVTEAQRGRRWAGGGGGHVPRRAGRRGKRRQREGAQGAGQHSTNGRRDGYDNAPTRGRPHVAPSSPRPQRVGGERGWGGGHVLRRGGRGQPRTIKQQETERSERTGRYIAYQQMKSSPGE